MPKKEEVREEEINEVETPIIRPVPTVAPKREILTVSQGINRDAIKENILKSMHIAEQSLKAENKALKERIAQLEAKVKHYEG